jgi:hypothetical protein
MVIDWFLCCAFLLNLVRVWWKVDLLIVFIFVNVTIMVCVLECRLWVVLLLVRYWNVGLGRVDVLSDLFALFAAGS